ncbi:sensor histidine kinase [Actinokineospora pegani]|uniref:sensor histidine kinase n=1 Tax=Actinokineospora pegani TaxID=2654637 RepID=UPI0012EA2417|nr:histidine kinase [Actinokineospora pegani]
MAGSPGTTPDTDSRARASRLAPTLALLITTVVFTGFSVNAFQRVVQQDPSLTHVLPAAAALVAVLALQVGFFSNPRRERALHTPTGYAALALQAVLSGVPLLYYGDAWGGIPAMFAGSALVVLRGPAGWVVLGLTAVANGVNGYLTTADPVVEAAYYAAAVVVSALVVYAMVQLRSLVGQLNGAREELATLAVARERLRFARDLHDLLGFSLSAITLKSELAHRLLVSAPRRAVAELREILGIARQALVDVRAVASSYRALSLEDELESARSVLGAAEVAVVVEHGGPGQAGALAGLSQPARTVLATVLREGVTNLLRHSKAENCHIRFTRSGDNVVLEVVNDGVRPPQDADHRPGNGIDNLTTRVRALGGALDAAPADEDTFRLRVTVPAAREPLVGGEADAPDDTDALDNPDDPAPRSSALRPGKGAAVGTAVFVGYAFTSSSFVFNMSDGAPVWEKVLAVLCVLASLGIALGFFARPAARVRSTRGRVLLGVLAALLLAPILVLGSAFPVAPGFLAGSLLLALPARAGVPLFLTVVAGIVTAHVLLTGNPIMITYGLLVTVNQGLVVFGLTWLRSLAEELQAARSELADMAVTRERLRFARDLHDLLGFSLSAVTLKSELTLRLVERDPERAQQELAGIVDISRQALADVRSVASAYRELAVEEEVAAARALMTAANIDVTVRMQDLELAPAARTTLATVLREGVTNLLRHSDATHCEITLTREGDRAVLQITNDGLGPDGGPTLLGGSRGGDGIPNLSARVAELHGALDVRVVEDRYRLRAEVPLR